MEPPTPSLPSSRALLAAVRLWRLRMAVDAEGEAALRAELSDDEQARAERLLDGASRRRFVVARGALRQLLGNLLGERPRSIQIEEGPSGKPRLVGPEPTLGFNVSHCGDFALICIAAGLEVGVDLEALRPVPSAAAIARRRFSLAEADFVERGDAAAADDRASETDRRFLLCWTRKEAVVKALGAGLDFDLRSFSVPLEEPSGVVEIPGAGEEPAQRWLVQDVPLGDEHVAALALPSAAAADSAETLPPLRPDRRLGRYCEEIAVELTARPAPDGEAQGPSS